MGPAQSNLHFQSGRQSGHRTYVDERGGNFIPCRLVNDDELFEMAEQADRIEVREACPHSIAASDVSAVLASLNALSWLDRGLVTDPTTLRRAIRRKIGDQRARLRIKTGRNLLAGTITRDGAGQEVRVLLVVLAGRTVTSCEWQLAC